eukprot:gnl/TRDRNA2_/TRDRNA2_82811_c0_seq1.p1 gnl/TRDRNA2_/TRDRNA2_82811_c0~~gnl/TRDRNA2_/TRDRNA2_82811_c0_seq1.p1  ORF type:complete len:324 (+),score=82.56 gnl/TRDRNA2_/TRDRNA2_82811_c0_seq1:38-1009(+)
MQLHSTLSLLSLAATLVYASEEESEDEAPPRVRRMLAAEHEFESDLDDVTHKMGNSSRADYGQDYAEFREPSISDDELFPEAAALSSAQIHELHALFDSNADGLASYPEILEVTRVATEMLASKNLDMMIREMDTSGDGELTMAELEMMLAPPAGMEEGESYHEDLPPSTLTPLEVAKFKLADGDSSGGLNRKELRDFWHHDDRDDMLALHAKDVMRNFDSDYDDHLSLEEFKLAGSATMPDEQDFQKLDANNDSRINLEELKVFEKFTFKRESSLRKMIEAADKNGDKHVTADELFDAREKIRDENPEAHMHFWDLVSSQEL